MIQGPLVTMIQKVRRGERHVIWQLYSTRSRFHISYCIHIDTVASDVQVVEQANIRTWAVWHVFFKYILSIR